MLLLAESLALGGRHLLVTDGNNHVVLALVQPLDLKQVEGDGVGCSGWLGLITSLDNGKLKSRGSKRLSIGFLLFFFLFLLPLLLLGAPRSWPTPCQRSLGTRPGSPDSCTDLSSQELPSFYLKIIRRGTQRRVGEDK